MHIKRTDQHQISRPASRQAKLLKQSEYTCLQIGRWLYEKPQAPYERVQQRCQLERIGPRIYLVQIVNYRSVWRLSIWGESLSKQTLSQLVEAKKCIVLEAAKTTMNTVDCDPIDKQVAFAREFMNTIIGRLNGQPDSNQPSFDRRPQQYVRSILRLYYSSGDNLPYKVVNFKRFKSSSFRKNNEWCGNLQGAYDSRSQWREDDLSSTKVN